jgi:Plasmid pRiA4b ORF-3-like protein
MKAIKIKIWQEKDNALTLTVPINNTFDDLVYSVLKALKWDHDHQYAVYCSHSGSTQNTRRKNSIVYTTCPMAENEFESNEQLNQVKWEDVKNIYINYDFGDNHWFEGKILKTIEAGDQDITVDVPFKKRPKQYRRY